MIVCYNCIRALLRAKRLLLNIIHMGCVHMRLTFEEGGIAVAI